MTKKERIAAAMTKHSLSYLELIRRVAIDCDDFILFVREKTYPKDMSLWPRKCGDIFMAKPILTSFGTCFMTNPEYNMT